MTAFSRIHGVGQDQQWVWELKSVNHRYLDVVFRLPEPVRALEQTLRSVIRSYVHRGKLEVHLFGSMQMSGSTLMLNQSLLQQIFKCLKQMQALGQSCHVFSTQSNDIDWIELMKWPGLIQEVAEPAVSGEIGAQTALLESFEKAMTELVEARRAEGETIKTHLLNKLGLLLQYVRQAADLMPELIEQQKSKLKRKFAEFGPSIGEEWVGQELLCFIQKTDISEELERLAAHAQEVEHILLMTGPKVNAEVGPVGRRLDFLMQELNREANTLGAKSAHLKISQTAVDIKVCIEQMREQIQNLE